MARYIDVDKLKKDLKELPEQERIEYMGIYDVINSQPTTDVQEVKYGKWNTDESGVVICSECGEEHEWQDFRPSYCDMCGAKMKGV